MTLLVPTLFASLYAVIAYVAKDKDQTMHMVNVIDNTGDFINKFQDEKYIKFRYSNRPLNVEKKDLKNDNDLVLNISANKKDNVELFARKKTTLTLSDDIQRQMNDIAAGSSLVKAGIDTAQLHKIKSNITIKTSELTATGEQNANLGPAYALSFAGAILIYMSLFIYGAQVMRGVIEEKTSRIVEIIVSSVKPFQLMAGKIIGVGLVGLTQFVIWIGLSTAISYYLGVKSSGASGQVITFIHSLGANAGYELSCFVFYWLFTYILCVSYLFTVPDSPLAFWLSIIPLTAPVAMMMRLPFNVPDWQLAISMVLMVVGFIFTTYIAARIYRVGILMYGKKTSYKELAKWFFYRE